MKTLTFFWPNRAAHQQRTDASIVGFCFFFLSLSSLSYPLQLSPALTRSRRTSLSMRGTTSNKENHPFSPFLDLFSAKWLLEYVLLHQSKTFLTIYCILKYSCWVRGSCCLTMKLENWDEKQTIFLKFHFHTLFDCIYSRNYERWSVVWISSSSDNDNHVSQLSLGPTGGKGFIINLKKITLSWLYLQLPQSTC